MLLSLDLHNAFDSLSLDYLFYVLQKYGFGTHFLILLRTLYHEPTANLQIKGYSSSQLFISRGTRQGCPLSLILFILALEPLAIRIQDNQDIQGIMCGGLVHKCALFTDNILLLLSSQATSLPNLYSDLHLLSSISRLSVNHNKSLAMNIALEQQTVQALQNTFPFKWQTKGLPYLAVHLTPKRSNIIPPELLPII